MNLGGVVKRYTHEVLRGLKPWYLPYMRLTVTLTITRCDIRETCFAALVALENANEYLQSRDASRTNQTVVAVSGVVGASSSY